MRLHNEVTVRYECTLRLTEAEMRALDALTGYGFRPFLKVFYERMGRHYLEPYEKALQEFFVKVRTKGVPQLRAIDEAREKTEPMTDEKMEMVYHLQERVRELEANIA